MKFVAVCRSEKFSHSFFVFLAICKNLAKSLDICYDKEKNTFDRKEPNENIGGEEKK